MPSSSAPTVFRRRRPHDHNLPTQPSRSLRASSSPRRAPPGTTAARLCPRLASTPPSTWPTTTKRRTPTATRQWRRRYVARAALGCAASTLLPAPATPNAHSAHPTSTAGRQGQGQARQDQGEHAGQPCVRRPAATAQKRRRGPGDDKDDAPLFFSPRPPSPTPHTAARSWSSSSLKRTCSKSRWKASTSTSKR